MTATAAALVNALPTKGGEMQQDQRASHHTASHHDDVRVVNMGVEPMTLGLLDPRSDQLS